MTITYNDNRQRFEVINLKTDELKNIVNSGFKLKNNNYYSYNVFEILSFFDFFDELAQNRVEEVLANYESSFLEDLDIQLPCKNGLDYLPYQKAGINYSIERDNVLIADDMGLGKTIQAIGIMNSVFNDTRYKALIICPASLKFNWKKECEKWLILNKKIEIVNNKTNFNENNIFILNYDIAFKYQKVLSKIEFDIMVLDEVHYLKNKKARRTQSILGKIVGIKRLNPIKSKRNVFLTGTPILNKPIEIFNIVNFLFPFTFVSEMQFARKYCNAKHNGFGWDFGGASNLDELNFLLRANGMVRRLKKDVLKQLPDKVRNIIEIEIKSGKHIINDEFFEAIDYLELINKIPFNKQALFRKEVGLSKIQTITNHIENILESDKTKKIVVFAWHNEVIDTYFTNFKKYNPVKINGECNIIDRDKSVNSFQNDENCRIFIGNILAAGVGLTLTRSNHVVLAELNWDPSTLAQAEDRCHRIGQKNSVLIEYFIAHKTIEGRILQSLLNKISIIEQTLN